MANALKRAVGEASTIGTNILTVPVGATSTIIGCRASNKSASDATIYFTLNGTYICGADTDLPIGSSIDIMVGSKIVAEAGDIVTAYSSTDNSVDVVISYLEQS